MIILPLASILVSTSLIILLCSGDPKRRRTARLPGEGLSVPVRRLLAALACLPGIGWALFGDAAALLIWLGGVAVAGWFIALWFARIRQRAG